MEEKETGFRNSVAEKGHSSSFGLAIFYPLDQMIGTNMPSCRLWSGISEAYGITMNHVGFLALLS